MSNGYWGITGSIILGWMFFLPIQYRGIDLALIPFFVLDLAFIFLLKSKLIEPKVMQDHRFQVFADELDYNPSFAPISRP
jgi:hypothetical protein